MAEANVARRSIFAALLAAPVVAYPMKPKAALPPLKPGMIWVQVNEKSWNTLIECGKYFAEQDRAGR